MGAGVSGLVRLEQWSQAGKAYQPAFDSLAGEMKTLEKMLKQPLPLGEQSQCSFPLAMFGRSPQALATWRAQRFANPAAPKPGEKAADLDAAANLWSGYHGSQSSQARRAARGRSCRKTTSRASTRRRPGLGATPIRSSGDSSACCCGIWTSRCGAAASMRSGWRWPPAIRPKRRRCPPISARHYAVRPLVDKADRDRRRAEDLLFVGQESELAQYDKIARTLASLDRKQGAYPEAIGEGRG